MTSEHTTAARPGDAEYVGPVQAQALGRHGLGAELRWLRHAQSLDLTDVAASLEIAPTTLSRMETGQAPVKAAYLKVMLDLYEVHDEAQRARLTNLTRDGMRRSWHHGYRHLLPATARRYLDLETAAANLRSYSAHVLPDLAQTAGYAAAAIRAARPGLTGPRVRDLVTLQLRRQQRARSAGLQMHLIIDETSLLRPIGTAQVMATQLSHLLTLAADPGITLQVAELARPLPVLTGPFTILSFPDPDQPDVSCYAGIDGQITITTRDADLRAQHRAFTALTSTTASPSDTASILSKTVAHWERADS